MNRIKLLVVAIALLITVGASPLTVAGQDGEPSSEEPIPLPLVQKGPEGQLTMPHALEASNLMAPDATESCATYSYSGIVLLEHPDCTGNGLAFTGASGLINLTDYDWNDRASSIYVPSGWSLMTYEHTNGQGASRCISWTMYDLTKDWFDNSDVNMNDAISSVKAYTNDSCSAPDVRQNGSIQVSGDLVEGGRVFLTIPVKNFGNATSPRLHVYTEGYTANGDLWRADGADPTAVALGPGQSVNITVQHDLWSGHVGTWNTYGVYIWNDDSGGYYGPLPSNGHDQTINFQVEAAPGCDDVSQDGIVLFEHANCTGSSLRFPGGSALENLGDYGWNDRASSIYVPSGWSIITYEHNDGGGASRCVSWSMWDLSLDWFDDSSVNMNDAISSAQAFTNGSCGAPDIRQNGPIQISGDLIEGGIVYLTIPVKNFGNATSPRLHVYTEGQSADGSLWRADGADPTAVALDPGQTVNITVRHELWSGQSGWWSTDGVYVWNDDSDGYFGPLAANGYDQSVSFYVEAAPNCNNVSHNGVVLFEHANCSGAGLIFPGATALENLDDYGWNEQTSSIYVPSGWSIMTYEHNDGAGAHRCITGSMWDLSLDWFDNSDVNMNDAISSAQSFQNGACESSAAPDVRQAGSIQHSGNLIEGGKVYLTIPVKNFGNAPSAAMHVYAEGETVTGALWRADGAQPTAVVLAAGETVNFRVEHDLWPDHAGSWLTDGIYIWNDANDSYGGPLPANGYSQNESFYVAPGTVESEFQLHMAGSVAQNQHVRPAVTVLHEGGEGANYTVTVELWKSFSKLDEGRYTFTFGSSGSQQHTFDFGAQEPGRYSVFAVLERDSEEVGVESRSFVVGEDYLALEAAVGDLTMAAQGELNQAEDIAVDALTKGSTTATTEAVDFIGDELAGFALRLTEIDELADKGVEEAVGALIDWAEAFGVAPRASTSANGYWRDLVAGRSFGQLRQRVYDGQVVLLNDTIDQEFAWTATMQAEVLRREEVIGSANETIREGLWWDLDLTSPFVQRATLTEMKEQFDLVNDEVLPGLDTVETWVLVTLLLVILIAIIILLLPASVSATVLSIVAIVAKGVAFFYSALTSLLATLGTAKVVIALSLFVLMSTGVATVAEDRLGPFIVTEYDSALNYVRQGVAVSDLTVAEEPGLDVMLETDKDGARYELTTNAEYNGNVSVSTQVYSAEGQLLKIVAHGMMQPGATIEGNWELGPGEYWMITVADDGEKRMVTRRSFTIETASVDLQLALADSLLAPGDPVEPTVTVVNDSAGTASVPLVLTLMIPGSESIETELFTLSAGEERTFDYSLAYEVTGGALVRAAVSTQTGVQLDRIDRPFVVDEGSATAVNIASGAAYAPDATVEWPVTVTNRGTASVEAAIKFETYDLGDRRTVVYSRTETVSLDANDEETFTISPLDATRPGRYETRTFLNDERYRSDRFSVRAAGALYGVTSSDPLFAETMQPVTLTVHVENESYEKTDAAVQLQIIDPQNNHVEASLERTSEGIYMAQYTPEIPGTYQLLLSMEKNGFATTTGAAFFIAGETSLLVLNQSGQQDNVSGQGLAAVRPDAFLVSNEHGAPIAEAMVSVWTSNGLVTGNSDTAGIVRLEGVSSLSETLQVEVSKPGFANTSARVTIEPIYEIFLPMTTSGAD